MNKKYMFKKSIFAMGGLTAVVAPVATLVACGSESSPRLLSNDEESALSAAQAKAQHEQMGLLFKEWSGWKMTEKDAFYQIINTQKNGMLNLTRAMDFDIPKPTTSPALEITFTKKELIENPEAANLKSTEIKNFLDKDLTKNFIAYITELKQDEKNSLGNFESGEYKIELFENSVSNEVNNASLIFSDSNKFGANLEVIQKMGGSYILSPAGGFGDAIDKFTTSGDHTIFGNVVTAKGEFMDRANEDSMLSWTGFGPKDGLTETDKTSLNGVSVSAYDEEDKNTHIWKTVLTIKIGDSVKTIFVDMPELTKFSSVKSSPESIVAGLKQNDFYKFYKFFDENFSNGASMLDSKRITNVKTHVVSLSALLPEMAKFSNLTTSTSFIGAISAYINKNHQDFDLDTFSEVLSNIGERELGNPVSWGAKRYEILVFLERFYTIAKEFIFSSEGISFTGQLNNASSANEFYELIRIRREFDEYLKNTVDYQSGIDLSRPMDEVKAAIEAAKTAPFIEALKAIDVNDSGWQIPERSIQRYMSNEDFKGTSIEIMGKVIKTPIGLAFTEAPKLWTLIKNVLKTNNLNNIEAWITSVDQANHTATFNLKFTNPNNHQDIILNDIILGTHA